ncbi:MAG: HAMP domain-containing sensor histidine kinase [Kofleriaceae bacterium]|nr:HAMP domain-containing sensor histidine kinase [Kofleriaceae bacterium]
MTVAPARRRLALRVYGFVAVLTIATMVALLVLPRYMRGARYLEPQAALFQYMVDRMSVKNPEEFTAMLDRIQPRLRGNLTIFDANGRMVRTTIEPPLAWATGSELAALKKGKWALDLGRIVVRSDDASMIGVYHPNRPSFPWAFILPMCGAILLVVGGASIWFSRRLAHPLDQLAEAARKFGAGDTTARADLKRNDELGEVGRAFDEMAERTSAVIQAQRQLMGDVSHELRTPLARIRVALELAAEDPVAAKDVLADVGADLDEIDQLISDILTTARLDGTDVAIDRRPTNVGELAERAVHRFAARHPGRCLEPMIAGGERDIECDPVLLRRAVDNLLDNAVKYSDAGTSVKLAVVQRQDRCLRDRRHRHRHVARGARARVHAVLARGLLAHAPHRRGWSRARARPPHRARARRRRHARVGARQGHDRAPRGAVALGLSARIRPTQSSKAS